MSWNRLPSWTVPELPEVEVVRRSLLPTLVGRRLGEVRVRERRLRVLVDTRALQQALTGRRVVDVRRRAKYLLLDLDGGFVLMVHLGMTGWLGVCPSRRRLDTHDHVVINVEGGKQLRFNDARRFGLVEVIPPGHEVHHRLLRHLGIEPFDGGFTGGFLRQAASRRKLPVKNFIMDARRVVGIGNIYASEALWDAQVHPGRAAGRLSTPRWNRLVTSIRKVLSASIEQGGTTIRDFAAADGRPGYFALQLHVYDRKGEPCHRCHHPIRRVMHSGRSTYYCPGCQH